MKRLLTLVSSLTVATACACDPVDDPMCPGEGTPPASTFDNPETQEDGQGKRGLTWRLAARVESLDAEYVSCGYDDGVAECDAYSGDTLCSSERPLLCIQVTGAENPGVVQGDCSSGWVGGSLALSEPVRGDTLESAEHADSLCAARFGDGWRMVEFHDGGGWTFWANGRLDPDTRFWVWIDDQDANCW